jgi:hypothetical protein
MESEELQAALKTKGKKWAGLEFKQEVKHEQG